MNSTAAISLHARGQRSGFTLVELMIVFMVLAILAAVVIPKFQSSSDVARAEALASNVRHVRSLILLHAGKKDVPHSSGGYPVTIDAAWFRTGALPAHAFSDRPMLAQMVAGASNDVFPAIKTFDPANPAAFSAWYNATNGAFCALVPAQHNDADTLALFNDVNKSEAKTLTQTRR